MIRKFAWILPAVCLLCGVAAAQSYGKKLYLSKIPLSQWVAVMKDAAADPAAEFTQKDGIIRLSGKYGYVRTPEQYSNYRLTVEWRWVEEPSNSGIFVHLYEDGIWPSGYECQLQTANAGDLVNSGNAASNEMRSNTNERKHIILKMNPSNERGDGAWNKAEILCEADNMLVYINGELQNKLTGLSSSRGYIGLQSEGKAVEFRSVVLQPLVYE